MNEIGKLPFVLSREPFALSCELAEQSKGDSNLMKFNIKLCAWFDKLTTNEISELPFVLSLSKDLIKGSLNYRHDRFGASHRARYSFSNPRLLAISAS